MKKVSNFTKFLIFFLVLVVLLWVIPNQKIESIGDFINKIVTPISIPLSLIITAQSDVSRYKRFKHDKKKKSP